MEHLCFTKWFCRLHADFCGCEHEVEMNAIVSEPDFYLPIFLSDVILPIWLYRVVSKLQTHPAFVQRLVILNIT